MLGGDSKIMGFDDGRFMIWGIWRFFRVLKLGFENLWGFEGSRRRSD